MYTPVSAFSMVPPYGVTVDSTEGDGTVVTLLMPSIYENTIPHILPDSDN